MVVVCVGILTKSGKILFARASMAMPRHRLEGLLGSFPKLVGADSQHTFVETDQVRYVYQPIEQLYLVLVTNKQSNIMEDLETLRLLLKVIPECCENHSEESIRKNVFELLFAVDEILNLGHRESITMGQLKAQLLMDSHEERLSNIILESKMNEAREAARKKADEIEKKKAALKLEGGRPTRFQDSYSSPSEGYPGEHISTSPPVYSQPIIQQEKPKEKPKESVSSKPIAGMKLGQGKKGNRDDQVAGLLKEEKLPLTIPLSSAVKGKAAEAVQEAAPVADRKSVHVLVEEKITAVLDREAAVKTLEVNGLLKLSVFHPSVSKISLKTNGPLGKNEGYRCRLHPKLDQKEWDSNGQLALKDKTKPFPLGSENAPVLLKYKLTLKDETDLPFTVNFWVESEDQRSNITVEITHNGDRGMPVDGLTVTIPCGPASPEVPEVDGDTFYDSKQRKLTWRLPDLSEAKDRANLSMSVPEMDSDSFYPLTFLFTSPQPYTTLEVESIIKADDDSEAEFSLTETVGVDSFTME